MFLGGSYNGNKTTLEVERVPNQLIRWSQLAPGEKLRKGQRSATRARALARRAEPCRAEARRGVACAAT
jgi:hypothetical protein